MVHSYSGRMGIVAGIGQPTITVEVLFAVLSRPLLPVGVDMRV
jgi:hypothetical protein